MESPLNLTIRQISNAGRNQHLAKITVWSYFACRCPCNDRTVWKVNGIRNQSGGHVGNGRILSNNGDGIGNP